MSNSTILSDWRLACDMDASPDELKAFVASKHALRLAAIDAGVVLAVQELSRMKSWAQIAALPELCLTVIVGRRAEVEVIETLFQKMIRRCEPEVRRSLDTAIQAFCDRADAREIVSLLKGVTGKLPSNPEAIVDRSHLSLDSREVQMIVLAILNAMAIQDSTVLRVCLGESDEQIKDPLFLLIDSSLRGELGRWPMLFAVDVCLSLPGLRPRRALLSALNLMSDEPALDADLVHRFVRLAFLPRPSTQADSSAGEFIDELYTFSRWRELFGVRFDAPPRVKGQPYSYDEARRTRRALAAAIWQDGVLRLMCDELGSADLAFTPLYRPRVMDLAVTQSREIAPGRVDEQNVLTVRPNRSLRDRRVTAKLIVELLQDCGEAVDSIIFEENGLDGSLAAAPWFTPNSRFHQKKRIVPKVTHLLRMVSWAAIACEMLVPLPEKQIESLSSRYLGFFVFHCVYWFDAHRRTAKAASLPDYFSAPDVVALREVAESVVLKTAGGQYLSPPPEFFSRLLDQVMTFRFLKDDIEHAEAEQPARWAREAVRQIESGLLLVQQAVAITETEERVGRWLAESSSVTTHLIAILADGRQKSADHAILSAKCLRRFIEGSDSDADLAFRNPLSEVTASGTWITRKHNRSFLLAPTTSYQDWSCGEQRIEFEDDQLASALCIAAQRTAAAYSDRDVPAGTSDAWLANLRILLSRANSRVHFDRFLQLRLVELLRTGVFDDSPEIIDLIFRRIVEFGSNHGLKQLAGWILDTPARTEEVANRKRAFYAALLRYLNLLALSQRDIERPQDPDERARRGARARILRRMMSNCLITRGAEGMVLSATLAAAAANERNRFIAGYAWELGESSPVEVDREGRNLPMNGRSSIELHTTQLIAFHAHRSAIRRLTGLNKEPEVTDLFASTGSTLQRKGSYLGIVADAQEDPVIFFSVDRYLTVDAAKCPILKQGDVVVVSHSVVEDRTLSSDRVSKVRIAGSNDVRGRTWEINIDGLGAGVKVRARAPDGQLLNWTKETPNFLALFAPPAAQRSFLVRERLGSTTRSSIPVFVGGLTDLLLDEADILARSQGLPLCLLSVDREGGGSSVLVETRPFHRYRLDLRFDMTAAGRIRLEEIVGAVARKFSAGYTGLLVTFGLVVEPDGPKLEVVTDLAQIEVAWCTQMIEAPIDERNLLWRAAFTERAPDDVADDEKLPGVLELRAIREGPSDPFFVHIPVSLEGFPQQAEMKLARSARRDELSVFVLIDPARHDGDPYAATFNGDVIEAYALDLKRCQDLNTYTDWLLGDKTQPHVIVERFGTVIPQLGLIHGYTKENLQVQIYVESLSLIPFGPSQPSGIWGRRTVRVLSATQTPCEVVPDFDIAEIPGAAFMGDVAMGILVSMPRRVEEQSQNLCTVIWRTIENVQESTLQIKNLETLRQSRLQPGSRIVVERRDAQHCKRIDIARIFGEALWQEGKTDCDALFAGRVRADNRVFDVFETSPGKFCKQVSAVGPESAHLDYIQNHFRDCRLVSQKARSPRYVPRPKLRGERTWRVVLAAENGASTSSRSRHIAGWRTDGEAFEGPCRLSLLDLEMLPERIGSELFFSFRRRMRIRAESDGAPEASQIGGDPTERADRIIRKPEDAANILRVWFEHSRVVDGRHDHRLGRFVPDDRYARRLLPNGISLGEGGCSRLFSARTEGGFASTSARMVITDPVLGQCSYVDTPSFLLDEMLAHFGAGEEGSKFQLSDDIQLFYVGRSGNTTDAPLLFEWGYGLWASLSPSQVHFRGKKIETAEFALFFGDRITELRWSQDAQGDAILSIERTIYSAAHLIYDQANDFQVIHLLHISMPIDGVLRIESIDGFDSRDRDSIVREFHGLRAELDRDSASEVARLLAKKRGAGDTDGIAIFGRVQTAAFEREGGRSLLFRAVRSGHIQRNNLDPLKRNDRFFVEAEEIFAPHENDLALRVSPLSVLPEETVDPRIYQVFDDGTKRSSLRVTRRTFSYDEGALARISGFYTRTPNPLALKSRILMVRITYIDDARMELSHLDGSPPRHPRVLDGLLSESQNRLFAILVGRARGRKFVRLELRPGALVDLESQAIELPPNSDRGDVLRIEHKDGLTDGRYRAVFAIYNDRKYARIRRPVVALPAAGLLRFRPPFSSAAEVRKACENFTVGDFRQLWATLTPTMAYGNGDVEAGLVKFMSRPHPKLAWLETTASEQCALTPASALETLAGRLVFSSELTNGERAPVPWVELLKDDGHSAVTKFGSDWYRLTYRTGGAREIFRRLQNSKWSYHDRSSIQWKLDTRLFPIQFPLDLHDVATGPLFFSLDQGTAVLRFPAKELPKRSLGLANFRHLLSERTPLETVVAGVPEEGGLYLELLPGRIFEIPWAIAGHDESDPVPLDKFAWQVFAAGDTVELRRSMSRADRNAQEGVLLSWRHGVNNALGPNGALLPLAGTDAANGTALYKLGEYEIELPTTHVDRCPPHAYVGGDRFLRRATIADGPEIGSTVFLTNRDGRCIVEQFPDWSFFVDAEAGPELRSDPFLGAAIYVDSSGRTAVDKRALAALVDSAAGAVPITVNDVRPPKAGQRGLIFFSRAHQTLVMKSGEIALARVLGHHTNARSVVLAIGGLHLVIAVQDLIGGLPEHLRQAAIDSLARERIDVWVRRLESGFGTGLSDVARDRIRVRPINIVSERDLERPVDDEQIFVGIVCVGVDDHKLYWLDADEAGVTRFTRSQAALAFPLRTEAFDVVRLRNGAISIVALPRVKSEIEALRLGTPLTVRPVPEALTNSTAGLPNFDRTSDFRGQLARSTATGLTFTLALRSGAEPFTIPKPVSVEVAWRWVEEGAVKLIVVEKGYMPVRHDLFFSQTTTQTTQSSEGRFIIGLNDSYGGVEASSLFDTPPALTEETLLSLTKQLSEKRVFGLRLGFTLSRLLYSISQAKGLNADNAELALWNLHEEIGRRALRAFHLEPVCQRQAAQLKGEILSQETDSLHGPVEQLLAQLGNREQKFGACEEIEDSLHSLMLLAALDPQTTYATQLAHALAAGIGSGYDLSVLHANSRVIGPVVRVLRPYILQRNMMNARAIANIHFQAMEVVREVSSILDEDDFDIALLSSFSTKS
jgi:hypothetical protein